MLEELKPLWPAQRGTYHCRSPACCKTHCHSCSHSHPLSARGGSLCRPGSASLWDPSRRHRTHGRLQEEPRVEKTDCNFSFKGFRIYKEDVGTFSPKPLGTYVHCRRKEPPPPPKNKRKTFPVGHRHNFRKLLLGELEQETRGF